MSSPKPPPGPPPGLSPETVGDVIGAPPPLSALELPALDARWRGIDVFCRWLASLVYRRSAGPSRPAESFTLAYGHDVKLPSIFAEMPDNVTDLPIPCIGALPGRGSYVTRSSLGGVEPEVDPAQTGSPQAAVVVPYDYTEQVTFEVWGSKLAERMALIAAIEIAMSIYEGSSDLRLVVPDYYGLVASYTLRDAERLDGIESMRGRRLAHFYVDMVVPVAFGIDVRELNVFVGGGATGGAAIAAATTIAAPWQQGLPVGAAVDGIVIDGSVPGVAEVEMETHAADGRPVYSLDPYLYPQPPSYPRPGSFGRGRRR